MINRSSILTLLFVLIAIVQLAIPLSMIYQREQTLLKGVEFHFETRPVDPTDPFRGKYITLNFKNDFWLTDSLCTFERDDKVYAFLSEDSLGLAQIDSLSEFKPNGTVDYLTARVSYQSKRKDSVRVNLRLPFDRFYMEESKAETAELAVDTDRRTDTLQTYALVKVRNGNAVLEDVIVDDISIQTWVEQIHAKSESR